MTEHICEFDSSARFTIQRLEGLTTKDSFNAGIIPDGDGYLIGYRPRVGHNSIGFARIDRSGTVMQSPNPPIEMGWFHNDDPRLFRLDNRLLLMTNYYGGGPSRIELREMSVGASQWIAQKSILGKFDTIDLWPDYTRRAEKNWQPFIHDGAVHFIYSVFPHRIIRFDETTRRVSLIHETNWTIPDACTKHLPAASNPSSVKGVGLRGNAPLAKLSDGSWLGTWHCRSPAKGYYTGFYLISGEPPFRILRFGRFPIICPRDSTGRNYRNGAGQNCVFVCGMVVDEQADQIILSGGDNDHSAILIRIKLTDVLDRMEDVNQPLQRRPLNLHVTETRNVGDQAAGPARYFPELNAERMNLASATPADIEGRDIIIGGGGLMSRSYEPRITNLLRFARSVTLWGMGEKLIDYPTWMRRCDLVGIRDPSSPFDWVPCASCMSPLFDDVPSPTREAVMFENTGWGALPDLPEIPRMSNQGCAMADAVAFLASAETILTNSYHGAYWGGLLGRRVVVYPHNHTSYKVIQLPIPAVVGNRARDWRADAMRCVPHPDALSICRDANQQFFRRWQKMVTAPKSVR